MINALGKGISKKIGIGIIGANNVLPAERSLDLINGESKWVTLPDQTAFDFTGTGFTVSAWVKFPSSVPANVFVALKRVLDGNIDFNFGFASSGKINFALYNDNSTTIRKSKISDAVEVSTGTWYLITTTYSGNDTASSDPIKFYKNNALVTATATNDFALTKSDDGIIGVGFNSVTGATTVGIRIAQLTLWSKELSLSEVQELYNSGSVLNPTSHSAVANLVGGYQFNGDATDSSANSYNGTEVNNPAYSTDEP